MPPLLEIRDLEVRFPVGGGWFGSPRAVVHAVDGVDLHVNAGEIVAVVGESGCGKTTLARSVLGLNQPTGGVIRFRDASLLDIKTTQQMRDHRREIQMIFQDPFDSLNPRKTVLQTLAQPLRIHGIVPRNQIRAEVVRLLDMVGLSPGESYLEPLSASVLGRTAPAHLHRPRHRAAAVSHCGGRGCLGARHIDPRSDSGPAAAAAERTRPQLSVHYP